MNAVFSVIYLSHMSSALATSDVEGSSTLFRTTAFQAVILPLGMSKP